jgi:hypothetical protein
MRLSHCSRNRHIAGSTVKAAEEVSIPWLLPAQLPWERWALCRVTARQPDFSAIFSVYLELMRPLPRVLVDSAKSSDRKFAVQKSAGQKIPHGVQNITKFFDVRPSQNAVSAQAQAQVRTSTPQQP